MDAQTIERTRCAAERYHRLQPATNAWIGLARMLQLTEKLLTNQRKAQGLNAGQMDIFLVASECEGLTQQELAARLCHTKANVSQLLDKMERTGHLRRVPDGRAYRVYVTDEGRALVDTVLPRQERIIDDAFAGLTEDERESLYHIAAIIDPGKDVAR